MTDEEKLNILGKKYSAFIKENWIDDIRQASSKNIDELEDLLIHQLFFKQHKRVPTSKEVEELRIK